MSWFVFEHRPIKHNKGFDTSICIPFRLYFLILKSMLTNTPHACDMNEFWRLLQLCRHDTNAFLHSFLVWLAPINYRGLCPFLLCNMRQPTWSWSSTANFSVDFIRSDSIEIILPNDARPILQESLSSSLTVLDPSNSSWNCIIDC